MNKNALSRREFFSSLSLIALTTPVALSSVRLSRPTVFHARGIVDGVSAYVTKVVPHSWTVIKNCVFRIHWASGYALETEGVVQDVTIAGNIFKRDTPPLWARMLHMLPCSTLLLLSSCAVTPQSSWDWLRIVSEAIVEVVPCVVGP